MASKLSTKIRQLMKERGLSGRGLAEKAELSPAAINNFLKRVENGTGKDMRSGTAEKIARVLGVPVETLLGAQAASAEIPFVDFEEWVHNNKVLVQTITRHGKKVTVGDVLRYRASPSNKGQDPDKVWNQMVGLREGLDTEASVALSEAEDVTVGPKPRRKGH